MKKTLIIILLISLLFVMGMRSRYGPFIWQTVSGGIQYIGGNVTLTNGDLTIATGDSFTVGTTTWTSSDEIDGTKIKDADYGDVDVSAGGAWTMDTDSVADNEIDYANVTFADFDYETADKMFHSNNAGDVTEITLGADGTFLESNGATSAPAFRALTSVDVTGAAETYLMIETVIKTISIDDDASADDFQFDDDQGNTTEQKVNLGNLIPAYGELVSAQLRCFETVTDSGGDAVMAIDLGTATGGAEIFATADVDSANDITATGAGDGPEIVATAAAKAVWINATPDVNWNTFLTGRWSVMITYIDYGAVHTAGIP